MYDKTVTVFNKYVRDKKIYWYPHVLTGVDLIIDKGANIVKTGLDGADTAKLHVRYVSENESIMINDLKWLAPKAWTAQEEEQLMKTITFAGGDFFCEGEYPTDIVADEEYNAGITSTGFFDYMNRKHDYVFLITNVGGPYTVIPHFEIGGK